jgi:hypothetical protein
MNFTIFKQSNNWDDFKSQLLTLTPKGKGDAFGKQRGRGLKCLETDIIFRGR